MSRLAAACRRLAGPLVLALAASATAEPPAARLADRIVAVGLFARAAAVAIKPVGAFRVIDQMTGEIKDLVSGREYTVAAEAVGHGAARLVFGSLRFKGPTRLLPGKPDEYVTIGERKYPGNLLFRPNKDATVTVVHEVGLEEYLFGVLPHEMSPDWPMEALKAQAVVSRTFALNNLGHYAEEGFDLTDDDLSQVYTGLTTVSDRVKQAVRDTAGETLTYAGKPLKVYFHSTCGGHTSDSEDVWGQPSPKPLKGVKDPWCKVSPHYKWQATFTTKEILAALKDNGLHVSRVLDIREGERGTAGWLADVRVKTDRGWKTIPANDFRLWLGQKDFKSTRLTAIHRRYRTYDFEGRGYGHGVGLCQWGARAQAEAGVKYEDILSFYFPGSKLQRGEP